MLEMAQILIADDDPTFRLLMRTALEKSGFQVLESGDGEEALSVFREEAPDLILLDVEMPRLDGFAVCTAIRREKGDDIPIVLVTGLDDTAAIDLAYESGATDFVTKPVNWSLIGHRVRYVLRASHNLHALHAAESRNLAMLRAIPDLLFSVDDSGLILDAHGSATNGSGSHTPQAGQHLSGVYPQEVASAYMERIRAALLKGEVQTLDYSLPAEGGDTLHFESRIAVCGPNEALCLARDITSRKEAESQIRYLAYYDSLTGLANRHSFMERLARELGRAKRRGGRLAVLFLDLDGFKEINDTLGHNMGDVILQWTAMRLRDGLRPSDLVSRPGMEEAEADLARLGGDEFTILLPVVGMPEDALAVGHRILDLMRRPFVLEGREVVLTASIGIAIFPDDGDDAAALLKYADTAMYHAKGKGRDNCQFYSASLTTRTLKRLTMENNLRRALEHGEFRMVYQPQIDLGTGRIHSAEALIRWHHPEQGPIPPSEFIPLAEAMGLVATIGEWTLRTACTDAMGWQSPDLPPVRVAVNLSPLQFRNPSLMQGILGILRETGFPPSLLELEITEGALMEDNERNLELLRTLRKAGVHIALDDFGTGYSSLSYLKRLPLTKLKVDRSFVRDLPEDSEDYAIVRAIVALAQTLQLKVTAEGAETLEQARSLHDLGCDTLQGFFFSKPQAAEDIPALLLRQWEIGGACPP